MSLDDDNENDGLGSEIVIRHYGLLEPIDWNTDCDEELNLMDQFWNNLIDIHEQYAAYYFAEILKNDDLFQAKKNYERLISEGSGPKIIFAAKKVLAITQKDVSRRLAPELRSLELARREEVKVARQNSGLWWGNYNAIVRSFESARSAAVRGGNTMRRRIVGGDGRFTNTLKGGAPVERLFDGSLSQVMIRQPPTSAWSADSRGDRRRLQRTTLTATVFVRLGERRNVTWPMVMHRPIPSDCVVKNLIVTRRWIGGRWKWAASFACTRAAGPAPRLPVGSEPLAVDLGWRRVPDGLRVATVMAAGAEPRFVTLPTEMLESFNFVDELRERVRTSGRVGIDLLQSADASLFEHPYQDLLLAFQKAEDKKFARLGQFCSSDFFFRQSKEVVSAEIYKWRLEYLKLTRWFSNQQRKTVARRNHMYQNIAIDILKNASELIVNDLKVGEIATRGQTKADASFFPRRANHYRIIASPSVFVRIIKLQAAKRGIAFAKGKATTPVSCPECGSTDRKTRADALPQICANCGMSFDQDVAACRSLLSFKKKAASISDIGM